MRLGMVSSRFSRVNRSIDLLLLAPVTGSKATVPGPVTTRLQIEDRVIAVLVFYKTKWIMFWYLGPGSVSGSCKEMLLAAAPSERYLKSVNKKSSTTSFHPTFECPSSSSQRPPKLHCGLSTSGALERTNCIFKIVDALSKIGDSPSLLFLNICPLFHVIDLSVNVYAVLNVFSKICFVARVILFLSRT